jgi:hypothetical protein
MDYFLPVCSRDDTISLQLTCDDEKWKLFVGRC